LIFFNYLYIEAKSISLILFNIWTGIIPNDDELLIEHNRVQKSEERKAKLHGLYAFLK